MPRGGGYTDECIVVFKELPFLQQPLCPGCVSLVLVEKLDQRAWVNRVALGKGVRGQQSGIHFCGSTFLGVEVVSDMWLAKQ